MTTIAITKTGMKTRALTLIIAIAAAILLPQVFHWIGMVSGTNALPGAVFLPMHIPVLLAGLLGGPIVGIVAGVVSPLLSFAISGMPAAALLPFMVVELAGYGLAAGLLAKTKMPVIAKVVIAQVVGRALRTAAVMIAVYGFGSQAVQMAQLVDMVTIALPGIILQWVLIPLIMYRMEGLKKYYE